MHKHYSFVALLLVFYTYVGYIHADEQSTEAREKALTAAKFVINQIDTKLREVKINEEKLLTAMKTSKADYVDPTKSYALCEKLARQELEEWRTAQVRDMLDKYDPPSPNGLKPLITNVERKEFLTCPKEPLNANLTENFRASYLRVRQKAISEQWKLFEKVIYPSEAEFDESDFDKLRKLLMQRHLDVAKEPVFYENRQYLLNLKIEPILSDAVKQRDEQLALVRDSVGGTSISPVDIEAAILDELNQLHQSNVAAKRDHVYDVFPSVKQTIPTRAVDIASEKFAKAVRGMQLNVTKNEVKGILMPHLADHVDENKSWDLVKQAYQSPFEKAVLRDYTKLVPKEKTEEFKSILVGLLQNSQEVKESLGQLMDRILSNSYREARAEIANEQIDKYFNPLVSKNWIPSNEIVERQWGKATIEISDPLNLPGISREKVNTSQLFPETQNLVRRREAELIILGVKALYSQNEEVASITKALEPSISQLKSPPTLKDLIDHLRNEVVEEWQKNELAKRHTELFPRTEENIKLHAKALLQRDTLRRESELRAQQEERLRQQREKEDRERREAEIKAAKAQAEQREKAEHKKLEDEVQAAKVQAEADARKIAEEAKQENSTGQGKGSDSGNSDGAGKGNGGGGDGTGGGTGDGTGSGSGSGNGEGTGGGMPLPTEGPIPDLVIDFDIVQNSVQVTFSDGKNGTELSKLSFNSDDCRQPDVFMKHYSTLVDRFTEWFQRNPQIVSEDDTAEYYILARIFSGSVPYGALAGIRQAATIAIRRIREGDRKINIYWYDNYFKPTERRKIPKDFKQLSAPLLLVTACIPHDICKWNEKTMLSLLSGDSLTLPLSTT